MATGAMPPIPRPTPGALPPPSPDVTRQMGGTPQDPMQGAAQQAAGASQANPAASVLSKLELVQKVLEQVGRDLPPFGPFADRAIQIIKAGAAEAAGGHEPQQPNILAAGSMSGHPTLRPPSAGVGMPG